MYNHLIYLQQVGLKTLGFDPGLLDGERGSNTDAATAAWLDSLHAIPDSTLPSRICAIAQTQVGIREVTKNQGAGIEKFWSATTYPLGFKNREPYCAAFVCWVIREAVNRNETQFNLPNSPVAYDMEKWGSLNSKKGVKVFSNSGIIKPGDIFTLATASHVGIIVGVTRSTVITIGGNTDGSGAREGDGVYQSSRTISSLRKIIRIS